MVALYAVITILTALAEDQDAPALLLKKGKQKLPLPTVIFLAVGLVLTIVIGLMLIYNWLFILVTYAKLMIFTKWHHVKTL